MFASFFQLLLTELEGNLKFRVGNYQIGLVTAPGTPGFNIAVTPYAPTATPPATVAPAQ